MADGELSVIVEDRGISTALQRKLSYLLDDPKVQEGVTQIVKDAMNKFVPRATGNLAGSAKVVDDEVTWTAPYAHYQYVGEVYGPNFLVRDANGNPVLDDNGKLMWRSPRGEGSKFATGRSIQYHTAGTSAMWDTAMMSDANARRIMNIRITAYLKRMAKERDL